MPRKRKINVSDTTKLRKARRESQVEYWSRLGVAQSSGSRFENGQELPVPTAILITMFELGMVTETDITTARKAAGI